MRPKDTFLDRPPGESKEFCLGSFHLNSVYIGALGRHCSALWGLKLRTPHREHRRSARWLPLGFADTVGIPEDKPHDTVAAFVKAPSLQLRQLTSGTQRWVFSAGGSAAGELGNTRWTEKQVGFAGLSSCLSSDGRVRWQFFLLVAAGDKLEARSPAPAAPATRLLFLQPSRTGGKGGTVPAARARAGNRAHSPRGPGSGWAGARAHVGHGRQLQARWDLCVATLQAGTQVTVTGGRLEFLYAEHLPPGSWHLTQREGVGAILHSTLGFK